MYGCSGVVIVDDIEVVDFGECLCYGFGVCCECWEFEYVYWVVLEYCF